MFKPCFFLVLCNLRYTLIDNVLQEDIDQVGIIPSFKSDHSTIVLVINSVDTQSNAWTLLLEIQCELTE